MGGDADRVADMHPLVDVLGDIDVIGRGAFAPGVEVKVVGRRPAVGDGLA